MLGLGAGASTSSPTEAKYSLSLDGTNDYMELRSQSATSSLTYSVWVNVDANTSNVLYYGKTIFRCNTTTELKYWSDVTQSNITLTVDDYFNKWTHFVVTQTGTTYTIYQNGIQKGTGTVAAVSTTQGNSYIGRFSTQYFNGQISQVGIWNAVLDADAVTAIYNNGSPTNLTFDSGNYDNSSALQGYWRMGNGFFDDKANGIIHDQDNPGFGSNLVVNADFSTNEAADQTYLNGGLQFDNWVEQQSTGLRKFELTSDGQGIKCTIETANDYTWNQRIYQDVSSILTVGDVYEFSVDVLCSLARSFEACIETNGGAGDQFAPDDVALSANTRTVIKKVFRCTATSYSGSPMTFHLYPIGDVLPAGEFYEVRNPSLKKLNGNPGITSGGPTFSSDTP